MRTAQTEQIKARATFLNAIGSSSIVASLITPAIGLTVGVVSIQSLNLIATAVACTF